MFSPNNSEEYLIDGKPLSELRVVDLKDQLEKRGLSKSGSKNILVKRLRDSLALERDKLEQSTKDPDSAPNLEMKSCGSNIVAEYLEKQQQALQAAKKAAQAARAAAHDDSGSATGEEVAENDHDQTMDSQKEAIIVDEPSSRPGEGEQEEDEQRVKTIEADTAPKETDPFIPENEETPRIEEVSDPSNKEIVENPEVIVEEEDQGAEISNAEIVEEEEKENRSTAAEPHIVDIEDVTQNDEKDSSNVNDEDSSRSTSEENLQNDHDENTEPQKEASPIEGDEPVQKQPEEEIIEEDNNNKEIAEETELVVEKTNVVVEEEDQQQPNGFNRITTDHVVDDRDFVITNTETFKTEKPQRKRKWGSTTVGKRNTVSISSDSLKEIVGNVKAPETIIASTLDEPVQLDYDEDPAPKRIVISREDMEEEETTVEVVPDENELLPKKEKEKTKLVLEPLSYDEGFIRERSPSPARHPVSRIIHVRCLTRPFTVKALQEFAGKFGSFNKDEFWIDNIKSHCFIKYDKEEDAIEAREKLDNIRWPLSNPNVLHVDFANQDDLDRHVNKTSKENDRQPRNSFQAENKTDLHKPKERTVREISTNEINNSNKKSERNRSRSPKVNDHESKLWSKSREWDKGKESWRNGKSPPRRDERRGSRSPSYKRSDAKPQDVAPVKLLEDLFRKTKATPCLYWLPLSQEQINEKEKQRARRQMERNERLKQMAKFEERERERRRDKEREREKEKSGRDHHASLSNRPPAPSHRRR